MKTVLFLTFVAFTFINTSFAQTYYDNNFKLINSSYIIRIEDNHKSTAKSIEYKISKFIKDYCFHSNFIAVAIEYNDYSGLDILDTDLKLIKSCIVKSSTSFKAIAVNEKNEIVVLLTNGEIVKYDKELNIIN
jgi:hypothetical protein